MPSNSATGSAIDKLTNPGTKCFWLETSTRQGVTSDAAVSTTDDARVLLAHHLLTVAKDLDQSLEETADEAAEIAAENFYDVEEPDP